MYKRLLKNSAIYGIIPQLPKIASFFVLPLITPFLTGVDYGVIGILSAYIGAFSVFHLLGFNVIVHNSFYHHPKQYKWYWRQLYGFIWIWSIIYFSILGCLIYFTLPIEAHSDRWMIIILKIIPLWIFGPSDMLASAYFRLNHKAYPIAARALFAGLAAMVLNYYLIAELKMGYMGWIVSEFITAIISGILFFIPVYRRWNLTPIFNFKKRLIKRSLKISLPIIPHYYGSYLLNSSDRIIMERLDVPTREIGLYSLAYNFGAYINTITNAINQAIGPNLYELIKSNKWGDYEKIIFIFQSFMIFVCFSLSLWIPQWLPFLIRNDDLLQINYLLIIIIMSYSFKPLYIGCNQVVFYYEKTNILWRITLVAGVINIILNIIFIPIFGIYAAAVNTFLSLLYMALAGFAFDHFKKYNKAKLFPFFWLVFIMISFAVAIFFITHAILVKAGIQLTYIILLIIFNIIHRKYYSSLKPESIK